MSEHQHICWGCPPNHPAKHTLNVNNLSVYYGKICALSNISFETTCGHTLALMGPNGAGKTTLLKALAGLIPINSGEILWNQRPLCETRQEIAYLPQRSDIDWSFPITVKTLIEMGRYPSIGMWRKWKKHDDEIVQKSIVSLGLQDFIDRQISELSGGQQQRVFLARALAQEAHVLLLDEPFTGLDSPSSQLLGELLKSLAQEGRLIIASHHDLATAPELFDQTLLLKKDQIGFGKTSEILTPQTIKQVYHL